MRWLITKHTESGSTEVTAFQLDTARCLRICEVNWRWVGHKVGWWTHPLIVVATRPCNATKYTNTCFDTVKCALRARLDAEFTSKCKLGGYEGPAAATAAVAA
jgi:hypothetical protein